MITEGQHQNNHLRIISTKCVKNLISSHINQIPNLSRVKFAMLKQINIRIAMKKFSPLATQPLLKAYSLLNTNVMIKHYAMRALLLLCLLPLSTAVFATKWYVNDNSTTGDIYCTAIGGAGNSGLTQALPKSTLSATITAASNGDTIYIDAGTWVGYTHNINKSLTIIGAGTNKTFFLGNASGSGGGGNVRFATLAANNITIKNILFKWHAPAASGARIFDIDNRTGIRIENVVIRNNRGIASSLAPSIYIHGTSGVTINGLLFSCSGDGAVAGGAIKIQDNSTLVMTNSLFKKTEDFLDYGGALQLKSGTPSVSISNCTFNSCGANRGGAISVEAGSLTVTNTCFEDNYTTSSSPSNTEGGGAVYVNSASSTIVFNGCNFTGNCVHDNTGCGGGSSANGGAFKVVTGTLTLNSCTFTNNISVNNSSRVGRDLHMEGGTVNVNNCNFYSVYSNTTQAVNVSRTAGTLNWQASGVPTANGSGVATTKPEVTGTVNTISTTTPTSTTGTCIVASNIPDCGTTTCAPTMIDCPGDTSLTNCDVLPDLRANVSFYACSSTTISQSPAPGTILANGTTTVTFTVTDANGATATCSIQATMSGCACSPPAAPTGTATQTFCAINNPTVSDLSATGSSITWYDQSSGGTAYTGTESLVNGNHYYASQTVGGCESTTRFDVTVVLKDTTAPTGSATQSFCAINDPKVSDLLPAGASIKWYTTSTVGLPLASNTALTNGTHYYASQTSSGCESTNRLDVVVTIKDTTAPSGSSAQSFCSINNPKVSDLLPAGASINWYMTSTGGSPLASSTALTNSTHYYASQTSSGCESTNRLDVLVTLKDTTAPSGSSAQSFCAINTPKVSDLLPAGASINWYTSSTGGSPMATTTALTNGTHYYASQTSSGCESTNRLDVVVTIKDTTSPSGSSAQSFCAINNPKVSDLLPAGASINWYTTSTGGSPMATTTALTNSTHYYASQTSSGCESTTRLDVLVTIKDTVAPSGAAAQSFCAINNPKVSNLLPSGTTINWYSAGTGGVPLATTVALVDGTHYYASQTSSGCESTTRLDVLVSIKDTTAPSGLGSQSFCAIDQPTVADLLPNTGSIKWYNVSSGGVQLSSSVALVDGAHYYASQLSSGCESTNRLDVLVSIKDTTSPSGLTNQSFCSSVAPTVGDLLPQGSGITWYAVSNAGTPLLASELLVNGNHYFASQHANGCESTSRLDVLVSIGDPAAPTIADPSQEFCFGDFKQLSDLNALVSGSGLLWFDASGAAVLSSDTLKDGYYYAVQVVGSCQSIDSLEVQVIIHNPSAPTIGNTSPQFCDGDFKTVSILNSAAIGSQLAWYNQNGICNLTDTLVSGVYFATQTLNGCTSYDSLAVVVTINDPSAPTIADTHQVFCLSQHPVISNLNALVTGSALSWYDEQGALQQLNTPLKEGVYYATQVVGGCTSYDSLAVSIELTNPSAPTIADTNVDFCFVDFAKVSDLLPQITGAGLSWYNASGIAVQNSDTLQSGVYYVTQTIGGCEGLDSLALLVTIINPNKPTIANPSIELCHDAAGIFQGILTQISGLNLVLHDAQGNTVLPTDSVVSGTFSVFSSAGGCLSADSLVLTINVIDPTKPTGDSVQYFCAETYPTLADLAANGQSVYWFDNAGNGPLPLTTSLADNQHYFVRSNINGCSSSDSLHVRIHILDPQAPVGDSVQFFCASNNPKVSDLSASSTGTITWYDAWGTVVSGSDQIIDGMTYYATQTNTTTVTCEGLDSLNVLVWLDSIRLETLSVINPTCGQQDGKIEVLATSGYPNYVYTWMNGSSNESILDGVGNGVYTVTVLDSVNCTATASIVIKCDPEIAEFISTNGNNGNQNWNAGYTDASVQIFNRWGTMVYQAEPYMNDWNGAANVNGAMGNDTLPSGTYYYVLDPKDGSEIKTGYLELVH